MMKNKWIWIVLLICLTFGLVMTASAADYSMGYGYMEEDADSFLRRPAGGVSIMEEDPYAEIIEQAVPQMKEAMKNRDEEIAFTFYIDTMPVSAFSDICRRIYYGAMEHTGVPDEGDYLLWNAKGYGVKWSYAHMIGDDSTAVEEVTFTYGLQYRSTADMEMAVDDAVRKLIAELDLEGKNEYERVKAIYDWICANVTYDYANLNNAGYELKYTTYAAIINRTAVCQGYASLFYRLALEAGIDSRFIPGRGGDEDHGWNIVKLNGLYYNLDSTWDAGNKTYRYFLKNQVNFVRHIRSEAYDTPEFHAKYPMGAEDFDPAAVIPVTGIALDRNTAVLTEGDTLTLTATVTPEGASNKAVRWATTDPSVATVADGVVTGVSKGIAVITAVTEDGGYSAWCTLTVNEADPTKTYTINSVEGNVPGSGTFYAEVEFTKNISREAADTIVIAVYDGEELVDMTYVRACFDKGQTVIFGGVLEAREGCVLRAFVCDDLENMKGLSNVLEK